MLKVTELLIILILHNSLTILCEVDYFNHIELQDLRVIRSGDQNEPMTNLVTENPFLSSKDKPEGDYSWLTESIKDAAYYVRAHKFNEYDRRYEANAANATREYHGMFPRPPLRTLHWEVQKFCEPSFLECIEYLKLKLKDTAIKRQDDTSVVMQEQNWNNQNHSLQIQETDAECNRLLAKDNELGDPFLGPLERFQWRTTVSYYLCWYAMNEVDDLKHFNESCDNFANCLGSYGPNNNDVRAVDSEPFRCAMYSFCPDPCCPHNKHLSAMEGCDQSTENPCHIMPENEQRRCGFNRSENRNFHDLILNRWNVSCQCADRGYHWSSRYGICVDIDECTTTELDCDNHTEMCVNLPGSYQCACKWGFIWDQSQGKCIEHRAILVIKLERENEKKKKDKLAQSLVKRIFLKLVGSKSTYSREVSTFLMLLLLSVIFTLL